MSPENTNRTLRANSNANSLGAKKNVSQTRVAASRAAFALLLLLTLMLAATPLALAQTETVLHSFAGSPDGTLPYAGLAIDAKGNLYGTTYEGGANNEGTVFEVTPSETETVLYSFSGENGRNPYSGVVRDKEGNLYGTTSAGGSGYGTVFKLAPSGTETVLHSFANNGTDGVGPVAGLVMDKLGNLYGTTAYGGANNYGTVFEVTPSGTETVLYSFTGGKSDGCYPNGAGVALGKKNVLYGTTPQCGPEGHGIVFKLTQSGTETVLHSFPANSTDGSAPFAGVVLDKKGNLYGTTFYGGENSVGTVYKITPSGTETVLYSFNCADGCEPYAGVVFDKAGNLYGATSTGGLGYGTVFELSPAGTETVLHSFTGSPGGDGATPFYSGVVLGKKGALYGTTLNGGTNNYGTVYKVTP